MGDIQGHQLMGIEWTFVVLTLGLISLREYARLKLRGTILSWNDFFAVLAWVAFLLESVMDTILYKEHFFSDIVNDLAPDISEQVESIIAMKVVYVEDATYYICMYCVKASMLCFYADLVPKKMRKTRILMWTTVVTLIIGFLATELISFLICQPINTNWSQDPDTACNVGWTPWGNAFPYMFHLLTDLMIYTIPIPVLRAAKLPKRQKLGVYVIFGLGFLCVAFATAVIITSWLSKGVGIMWFFAALEQTWAIMIVCAPAFKFFMSKADIRHLRLSGRLSGRFRSSSSFGRGKVSSDASGDAIEKFRGIVVMQGRGGSSDGVAQTDEGKIGHAIRSLDSIERHLSSSNYQTDSEMQSTVDTIEEAKWHSKLRYVDSVDTDLEPGTLPQFPVPPYNPANRLPVRM